MKKLCLAALAAVSVSASAAQYTVVSDNSAVVERYARDHAAAEQYLADIKTLLDRNIPLLIDAQWDGLAPNVYAHTKKIVALMNQRDRFGEVFVDPLYYCGAVGVSAELAWSTLRSRPTDGLHVYGALDAYYKAVLGCESVLREAPEKTVVIEVSSAKSPPFDGCVKILNLVNDSKDDRTEWSCPASSLPKQ